MRRLGTLQARLGFISVMLFVMIAGFGAFTLHLFSEYNELSNDVRGRWLPNTRVLGDLNNTTSDFRTAEGDILLASGAAERTAQEAAISALGQSVAHAQKEYEQIPHTAPQNLIYASFARRWSVYRHMAGQVAQLAASGNPAPAIALYRTQSRSAYNAASDALGALTTFNVEQAQAASARVARAYREGRLLILVAVLLAGTLLGGALAYIRNWISRPMTKLAHSMRLLAANTTDLDIDGIDRSDEIGEMSRAVVVFRANAIELIQSQHGLAQQAAMLEQKLACEMDLACQQRNFISMISHEFRTPLTAIDAHAQRLNTMRDHIRPDDIADRARRIRSAVQRMTGLMDNLLSSSSLMDGNPELFYHPAAFDLAALLHDVCAFHRETAPRAHIGEAFGSTSLPYYGDQKLLFQTFGNLLSNAIKYSPDDVFVAVEAYQDGENVVVTVRDRGLGIPAQDLGGLFHRYYRGGNASGIVGTGIGLYLAKTVVTLHGGDITVQSDEGRGACFTVKLPMLSAHRVDNHVERVSKEVLF
jgi:signal transduction histidine kinase